MFAQKVSEVDAEVDEIKKHKQKQGTVKEKKKRVVNKDMYLTVNRHIQLKVFLVFNSFFIFFNNCTR
jgi:quinol-cytochrome oxidoreductase complex cytochrome b subunit